jgi:hypothetical protein
MVRAILWGVTREHHAELSLEQCATLMMEHPELNATLCEMIVGLVKPEADAGAAVDTPSDSVAA